VWNAGEKVIAIPYDFPVPGYKNRTVNTLRLWASRGSEEFLPDYINHGDYLRACEDKSRSGTVAKVLFPEEDVLRATELRLKQHYFLLAASLFDMLRRYKRDYGTIVGFETKAVIQLTGSNCALAVPELMRLLVDVENVPWKTAWDITRNVFAYTSTAVSKESLETWPVYMMTQVLPRHMEIIYEINQNHLDDIRARFGNRDDLVRELSIIQEGEVKRVKLANLALIARLPPTAFRGRRVKRSRKIFFPNSPWFSPEKFQNKTNGISTPPMAFVGQSALGRAHYQGNRRHLGAKTGKSFQTGTLCAQGRFLPSYGEHFTLPRKRLGMVHKKTVQYRGRTRGAFRRALQKNPPV